ncbi:MAG TPA: SDR family oxidoreductase [Solirubrobacteraceae bacterium]|jgi:3-oxoacyl-[acyl-carrier protein] reductase|nr:SDR family oxidoreductase [Solirubrobacteraceae bacterium]
MASDPTRLDGEVAVVTGAAQGIGQGIALALAGAGARVIIGDLQDAGVTVAQIREQGGEAEAMRMDVSSAEDAERLAAFAEERFDGLSILVNNAGIDAPPGHVIDLTLEEWQRTIDVNLTGAFLCAQAAVRRMLPRAGGSIVSLSSHASWLGSPGTSPAYNASKAGIIGLSAALSVQLGSRGIRSNAIAPATVRSRDFGWSAEEDAARSAMYTLGLGAPGDIGQVVRFLASPAARWVTGSLFYVHGGFLKEE